MFTDQPLPPIPGISWLLYPPLLVRLLRAFTFPLVVLTRHQLGERYYRVAPVGRALFIWLAIPTPLILLTAARPVTAQLPAGGTTLGIVATVVGVLVVVGFYVADRQVRNEIRTRQEKGILWHSQYLGVPRFGLPDDDFTNRVVLPSGVAFAGLALAFLSPGIGIYLIVAAITLYLEYVWRSYKAREAVLDSIDSSITREQMLASIAGKTTKEGRVVPNGLCTPAEAGALRQISGNPLAGFESLLTPTTRKEDKT